MKTSTILLIVIAIAVVAIGTYVLYQPAGPTATVTFQTATPLYGFQDTVLTVDGVSYNASQLPKSFTWTANTLHNFTWIDTANVVVGNYTWTLSSGPSTAKSGTFNATANSTMTASYNTNTFKVAAIYVTPIEEDWNQVLHQALIKARDNLGITYAYAERTSESDCERVAREFISNGYNMIITDSWGFWTTSDLLAPQFPNVFFAQGSGLNVNFGSNLALFDNMLQEATFEAGYISAQLTSTDKIGVVGPMQGPGDVASLINGYIAGAKYFNPDISIDIEYINSWYDPNTALAKAQILIASGVDVIYSERTGVYEACKQNNVTVCYAFGNVVNQNSWAPDVVVGSVIWNLYPTVSGLITDAWNGNFSSGIYYPSMQDGSAYIAWSDMFKTNFPDLYINATNLEPLIMNGTITWVVDGETVPLSVPNMGTPQP